MSQVSADERKIALRVLSLWSCLQGIEYAVIIPSLWHYLEVRLLLFEVGFGMVEKRLIVTRKGDLLESFSLAK